MRRRATSIQIRDAGTEPSKVSNRRTNRGNSQEAIEPTHTRLATSHSSSAANALAATATIGKKSLNLISVAHTFEHRAQKEGCGNC